MPGFDVFKQKLDDCKEDGLSVPAEIEEIVEDYQRQAEEVERLCLAQEARERKSELTRDVPAKQR